MPEHAADWLVPAVRPADLEPAPILSHELPNRAGAELATSARSTGSDLRDLAISVLQRHGYEIQHEGTSSQESRGSCVVVGESDVQEVGWPWRTFRALGFFTAGVALVVLGAMGEAPDGFGQPAAGYYWFQLFLWSLVVVGGLLANVRGRYTSEVVRVLIRSRSGSATRPAGQVSPSTGTWVCQVSVGGGEAFTRNSRMGWFPGGDRKVRALLPADWMQEEIRLLLHELQERMIPAAHPWEAPPVVVPMIP